VTIKRPWLTALGIVLIIGGALLLSVKGLPLVLDPTPNKEQTDDIVHPIKLDKMYTVNLIGDNNSELDHVKLNFDTTTIFDGDSVGVTATAFGVKPDVALIGIIIAEQSKNYTKFTGIQAVRDLNIDTAFNQSVILVPQTNPSFQTRTEFTFLQAFKPITFHGFVFLYNQSFAQLSSHETAFTILPKTDKLQAETNLAVLMQINETKKATFSQDTYNNIVLGLTWLGVGAIPVLVGTDILLRIYVSE